MLGDRYVSLQPGGEEQVLKPGDEIEFTESAVILERLIGKLIHNANVGDGTAKGGDEAGGDGTSDAPAQ